MEHRNIRQLRADLAASVRRAGAGQRVVITVGGVPMAELGPIGGNATETLEGLAARGLALAPRRADRPTADVLIALPVGTRIDRLLTEVR